MDSVKIYKFIFELLKQDRKKLIISFTLYFIIIAGITFLIPERYKSTLKIFPNQSETNTSSFNMLAQDFGLSGSGSSNFPLSEIAISNLVLNKIFLNKYQKTDGTLTSIKEVLSPKIKLFKSKIDKDFEKYMILQKFSNRLSVSYDRKSNITTLSISLEDAKVAKQVMDSFYDEISLFINQSINQAASYKRDFIETRILDVRKDLIESESNVEKFLNENKFIQDSPSLQIKLNELNREVSVKENAYLVLKQELELAKIDEIKNTMKIFILEKPEIAPVKHYPSKGKISLIGAIFMTLISLIFRNKNSIKRYFN